MTSTPNAFTALKIAASRPLLTRKTERTNPELISMRNRQIQNNLPLWAQKKNGKNVTAIFYETKKKTNVPTFVVDLCACCGLNTSIHVIKRTCKSCFTKRMNKLAELFEEIPKENKIEMAVETAIIASDLSSTPLSHHNMMSSYDVPSSEESGSSFFSLFK